MYAPGTTDELPAARRISDALAPSALAHPPRRRLLDLPKVHGPATVGLLAECSGEAVGSACHHLRVPAKAELIEEAPELARDRRERRERRGRSRPRAVPPLAGWG
ncbi:winged helix-turn-helix domain-containing protein [Kitasatospora phosalacinea]|uniref:Uncharacterized protein n=1 Tax=Kitasatospora phosalacinea TaxID=2065 RepID=A0A9W6PLM7_9ACTN|nr:helix-turn-helix domain-containing protein [Kitasatospora phosalacinea]GLW57037.1 hypothetical protein Kpho01_50480 [Kitasatospora phosalacinea]